MRRSSIDLQLLSHCTTERVLGEHALDCVLDNTLRMLRHGLFEGLALESSWITAVTIILFVSCLVARHADLVCIHDDDEIARINMWGVSWLMLTPQDLSSLRSNTTKDLVLCIDEEPFAIDLTWLCVISLHYVPPLVTVLVFKSCLLLSETQRILPLRSLIDRFWTTFDKLQTALPHGAFESEPLHNKLFFKFQSNKCARICANATRQRFMILCLVLDAND